MIVVRLMSDIQIFVVIEMINCKQSHRYVQYASITECRKYVHFVKAMLKNKKSKLVRFSTNLFLKNIYL